MATAFRGDGAEAGQAVGEHRTAGSQVLSGPGRQRLGTEPNHRRDFGVDRVAWTHTSNQIQPVIVNQHFSAVMKDLIVFRSGSKSMHNLWISNSSSYDVYICPYQDIQYMVASKGVQIGPTIVGAKWTGLHHLLTSWTAWKDYRYIMLADDDLLMPPGGPEAFFRLCDALNAKLCQPALTIESPSSHLIVYKNSEFIARSTTFVEIMAPCFRADILEQLLWTLDLSQTGWGWGLDYLWPKLLEYSDIYICDSTPMFHALPVGRGRTKEIMAQINNELSSITSLYNCRPIFKTLKGIRHDSADLDYGNPRLLLQLIRGYEYLLQRYPPLLKRLILEQEQPIPSVKD